jgi:SAM-dependent methyltransferase
MVKMSYNFSRPPIDRILDLLNRLLLPLKLLIPQPVVKKIPGLSTNEEIRHTEVLREITGVLLDIGCGTNQLVKRYRARGNEGVGVDVYPWPGVDTIVANSATLPFSGQSFSTITFVACLNHIPNRAEALLEARRLLHTDGRVIITNLSPWLSQIWHKYAFWDDDQHERGMQEGEVWGFSRSELAALLHGAGFSIERSRSFSWGLVQLYVCVPL